MKHLFPKFIIMAGLTVLLTAITLQRLQAHSGKARLHLIVDTDGAADDLRTLLMQLANREAEVLAIVTSEGALSPSTTALKADDLCADLYPYARKIATTHRPSSGSSTATTSRHGTIWWPSISTHRSCSTCAAYQRP